MEKNLNQTQPGVAPTPPTIPPVLPPKGKKLFVLMIVIHLIVLVIIGFIVHQNIQLKNQISHTQPTTVTSITPMAVATTDPTVNWKIYTNSKFGYSIAYPSGWYLDENEQSQPNAISIKNYLDSELTKEDKMNFLGGGKNSTNKMYIVLSVSSQKISNTTTIVDWLKANNNYVSDMSGAPTTATDVKIGSYTGVRLTYTGVVDSYYFRVGDTVFLTYFGPPSTNQPQSIFDQILSTFRFTQ